MNTKKLEELIRKKGVPIYKIEQDLGIANGTIWKWVNKGAVPKVDTAIKVAKYLGTTVEKLV